MFELFVYTLGFFVDLLLLSFERIKRPFVYGEKIVSSSPQTYAIAYKVDKLIRERKLPKIWPRSWNLKGYSSEHYLPTSGFEVSWRGMTIRIEDGDSPLDYRFKISGYNIENKLNKIINEYNSELKSSKTVSTFTWLRGWSFFPLNLGLLTSLHLIDKSRRYLIPFMIRDQLNLILSQKRSASLYLVGSKGKRLLAYFIAWHLKRRLYNFNSPVPLRELMKAVRGVEEGSIIFLSTSKFESKNFNSLPRFVARVVKDNAPKNSLVIIASRCRDKELETDFLFGI